MKYLIFFILFIFLAINTTLCQTSEIDSLLNRLENIPDDDTLKVIALLSTSNEFMNIDLNQSVKFGKKALQISKKIEDKKFIIKSYYIISKSFLLGSKPDSCIYYAEQAEILAENEKEYILLSKIYALYCFAFNFLSDQDSIISYAYKNVKLLEKIKDTTNLLEEAYFDLSDVYFTNFDLINAKKFALKAFKYSHKGKNYYILGRLYHRLGELNWEEYDTIKAKDFFLKAIENYKKNQDTTGLINSYISLFMVCEKDKKMKFLQKAEALSLQTGDISSLPYIYLEMGNTSKNNSSNYKKAINYYKKGLKYGKIYGSYLFTADLFSEIAFAFEKIEQMDSSIYYYRKALETSKKTGMGVEVQENYYNLYNLYKQLPNNDSALYYLELNNIIKDSLYNDNISKSNAEAYAKYETEKKEAEIIKQKLKVELEKKKKNRILFGGIALILFSGLMFQWFANRQKRKNKEKELSLKLKNKETELALKLKDVESKNLKELNDSKSRFFANITHEFRTPLTLIMGPLQDVIGKIKGENKEILKIAHSNSKRLLTLVNDILDLSTLEEGSPELNKSNVCLFAFLKRVFYSYESYAKIRQISTEMVLPPNKDVLVNIDLEKLKKIINNLLSNAFKYTETGGSVKLLVDLKEEEVFISVKDTGVGIDEKDIKHIFDRYFQGLNSENITGTGIGLSFADRLAKMMGGSISVESKRNEGSTFTLQIPLEFSEDCPENMQETEIDESIYSKSSSNYKVKAIFADKPRILIVEDNYEMQKYLSSILKEHFHVELAENGFEGLKKLKESNFDLVSSDVMMPGMDGFVFRQEMNKNLEWKNIPFILLTARSLKEDKLRGFKIGVDDYITKPFNATEYIARINNLIINKQERDKWINDKMEDINFPLEKNNDSGMIEELERIILENINNPDFKVTKLAVKANCSQRNLSRMTKKLIGLTPVNLILEVRLQKAYQLLKSNKYKTVSEVRYEVGIDNASYFSKKFTERFGVKPGEL